MKPFPRLSSGTLLPRLRGGEEGSMSVVLLGKEGCESCQQIKRLLSKFGIPYRYKTAEGGKVPRLVVNGQTFTGSTEIAKFLRAVKS